MTNTIRRWSTDQARPGEALAYWIDAICEAFLEMKAGSPEPESFATGITQHPLGPIDLNFADTTSQEVWRTRHAIAGSRKHLLSPVHARRAADRAPARPSSDCRA